MVHDRTTRKLTNAWCRESLFLFCTHRAKPNINSIIIHYFGHKKKKSAKNIFLHSLQAQKLEKNPLKKIPLNKCFRDKKLCDKMSLGQQVPRTKSPKDKKSLGQKVPRTKSP